MVSVGGLCFSNSNVPSSVLSDLALIFHHNSACESCETTNISQIWSFIPNFLNIDVSRPPPPLQTQMLIWAGKKITQSKLNKEV